MTLHTNSYFLLSLMLSMAPQRLISWRTLTKKYPRDPINPVH
ncbi:hypothetical protein HMPREF0733_12203 [Rothia dentocariosa ATCC 17931]|uniref:Uncharacterized protein n=1 Tax=Rothia dentocariosa (strain ATCC 17931 / CDC X599 / XDIA) TaxID=762948 RepID=E3H420_ROTDC|nr:hypothetical protein HMPREF0733_12203 [Rothia dentocariosa ATCC 17931]